MQVIKVRMTNQYIIDRRQIPESNSRPSLPLEDEQPARKVGIDRNIASSNLDKEAAVANERNSQFALADEMRFMRASGSWSDGGRSYELTELLCFTPDGDIQHLGPVS